MSGSEESRGQRVTRQRTASRSAPRESGIFELQMPRGVYVTFVGFIGILAIAATLGAGMVVARMSSGDGAAPEPAAALQVSSGSDIAGDAAAPAAQSGAAADTSSASEYRPAGPPAGDSVPIGDNPRLALDGLEPGETLPFGDVPVEQGPTTREFSVQNAGTQDLVISNVSANCSCTDVTVAEATVAPGDSTIVSVTHDPAAMLAHGSTSVNHTVSIVSNDPVAERVAVYMQGTVLE